MLTAPSNKAQSTSPRDSVRWFDGRRLRRAARAYGPGSWPGIVWRQMRSEWRLSRIGICFRQSQNAQACAAYGRMPWEDFCQINARQAWANWRSVPGALNGLLPRRHLSVVDLCCGTGDSTAVLAWCCGQESHILGIDVCPDLIGHVRQRRYHDDAGRSVPVLFRTQSVLETWCDTEGVPLEQDSIDLVNTCGAVGCHFDSDACNRLSLECQRVIRPGGLACIDSGPFGTKPEDVQAIFADRGFTLLQQTRSCIFDRYRQLTFRLDASQA